MYISRAAMVPTVLLFPSPFSPSHFSFLTQSFPFFSIFLSSLLNPSLSSPFFFLLSFLSPSLLPSLLPPPRNYRFPLSKVRKVHSSTFVHKLRQLYSHILCGCYKDDRTSFGMVLLQKYHYGQVILFC